MTQIIRFYMDISAEKILRYYKGKATNILVHAEDGRRIRLPVQNFRPFVTDTGIQGRFQLELGEENKLISLKKIS